MNNVAAPVPWFGGGTKPFEEDRFMDFGSDPSLFRWKARRRSSGGPSNASLPT
jgi:hypothetical protein